MEPYIIALIIIGIILIGAYLAYMENILETKEKSLKNRKATPIIRIGKFNCKTKINNDYVDNETTNLIFEL